MDAWIPFRHEGEVAVKGCITSISARCLVATNTGLSNRIALLVLRGESSASRLVVRITAMTERNWMTLPFTTRFFRLAALSFGAFEVSWTTGEV